MGTISTKFFSQDLGDSKVSLTQLNQSEKYILIVQDKNSEALSIIGTDDKGDYIFSTDSGGLMPENVAVTDITLEELERLGSIIRHVVDREKKEKELRENPPQYVRLMVQDPQNPQTVFVQALPQEPVAQEFIIVTRESPLGYEAAKAWIEKASRPGS